jgi:hypothetical protein
VWGHPYYPSPVPPMAPEPDWAEPTTPPAPMWNMAHTVPLLKKLQPESRKFGYHVCLGGGVLNHWSSEKDLDLYYLPLNNSEKSKPKELIHYLAGMWGKPEPIGKSAEYPAEALPYIAKLKFTLALDDEPKRRIDLFIMGATEFDMKECLDSLDIKLPSSFIAKIIHRKRSK